MENNMEPTKVPFADVVNQGRSIQATTAQQFIAEEVFRGICSIFNSDKNTEEFTKMVEAARERGYYEVKLVIDGKETKLELLGAAYEKINEFIEKRAKEIALENFSNAMNEVDYINSVLRDAKEKIMAKYGLDIRDYE